MFRTVSVKRKYHFGKCLFRAMYMIVAVFCVLWLGTATAKGLDETLVFEGKVHYSFTRIVRNGHEGDMKAVLVHDSQKVKKGDVLGRYRISEYVRWQLQQQISSSLLQQKQMRLDEAQAKLQGFKRDQAALVKLYESGMLAKGSVDQGAEAIEQFMRQIELLKQEVGQEEQRLSRERKKTAEGLGGATLRSGEIPKTVNIVSPVNGTVVWLVDEDEWELKKNTVCFKVADVANILLKAKVFVEDYPKLAEGMVATVTAKGQPGKKYQATLSKLPLTPIDKGFAALSYYLVEFEMENPDRLFREGYRVTVSIPPQEVGKNHASTQ